MTLAKIVAEGERLERELAAENARKRPDWHLVSDLSARLFHVYKHYGPTLLAVAKAAVEMRKTYGKLASLHSVDSGVPTWDVDADGELVQTGRTPDIDKPDCEHCRVLAAFDAAVRGEGKEVPRG